jgi:hypothetical protein
MRLFKSIIMGFGLLALSELTFANAFQDGGHDGGGANLWSSSEQQVREAIDWAFAEVREEKAFSGDGHDWLFLSSMFIPEVEVNGRTVSLGYCLRTPYACDLDRFAKDMEEGRKIYRTAWDYLSESRLTLKEDGPCPAADKPNAAGSVSAYKIGADLCLSVYELSRTPPGALKAQVASVLAHEMTHLLGFDENIAKIVQKAVVENFEKISRRDGAYLALQVEMAMADSKVALLSAASIYGDSDLGIRLYLLGHAAGIVHTITEILPDGLNDRTIPVAKPELYKVVEGALRNLKSNLRTLGWNGTRMSKAAFDSELAKLLEQHNTAAALLQEFIGKPWSR